MAKLIKNIDGHIIEADYSVWTSMAKIRVDNQERLSKFVFLSATEIVAVGDKKCIVKFRGTIFPDIEVTEI
ncbi:MAG: hypothetical protein ABIH42_04245 [Planctomycetota bacterium]